ncbi:MAG: metallophosphoesterase family protein [Acidimicrobiales bacterium]
MPVIVHLSDTHFGAQREELAESLVIDIWDRRPDLVVVSGDLTQRARRDEFTRARAFLDGLPEPVLTVMGNHDLPLFDVSRRLVSPTGRYRKFISPNLDPIVDLSALVAVGLDSMPAWRWKAGHVSRRQADLVRDALGNSPSGAWRVLVTHHPVLPATLSALRGRQQLADACDHASVAVLLSGHTHTASVDVVTFGTSGGRRALAVVAGTATSSRTRRTANAYNVVDLSGPMEVGATVTVQVREPDGITWSSARTACFSYSAGGIVANAPP